MKTIKRKISLEDFKCRFNIKNKYLNENGEINDVSENDNIWGKIPLDCSFDDVNVCPFEKIKTKILLNNGIDSSSIDSNVIKTENVFRFKDIIKWKKWLEDYNRTAKYYKLCKKGNDPKWVNIEGFFLINDYSIDNIEEKIIESVSVIPNTNEYNIGDLIEVNSNSNILNEIFRVKDDSTRYEIILYNFIIDYINGSALYTPSIPFFDLPIFIGETYDNNGILNTHAKPWDPTKTYTIGDVVIYNSETYCLVNGDRYSLDKVSGGYYDSLLKHYNENKENLYYSFKKLSELDKDSSANNIVYFNNLKRNIYYEYEDEMLVFYYPLLTHKAYYSPKDDTFLFNENFWVKNEEKEVLNEASGIILSGEDFNVGEEFLTKDSYYKSKGESQLTSVRRYKKTVDNDGNILPFIISENGSMDTELIFNLGISNRYIGRDGSLRGDLMKEIDFINSKDSESLSFIYDTPNNVTVYKTLLKPYNEVIDETIMLYCDKNYEVLLEYDKNFNTYIYEWEEIEKSNERDENTTYIDELPTVNKDNFDTLINISSITDDVTYYYTYKCIIKEKKITYIGTVKSDFTIRPSHMKLSSGDYFVSDGRVNFSYVKGALINEDYSLAENTGIIYNESYPYEIIIYGVNFVSPKEIETQIGVEHNYTLYDYVPKENDIINDFEIQSEPTYLDVGKIYKSSKKGNFIRVLSDYEAINISFDNGMNDNNSDEDTNIENETNNPILSNISFNVGQTIEDIAQKDYVFKDENLMGIEDIKKEININIERGVSSAFERLHIMSEVKSFNDLLNYKNNYFKL